MSKYVLGIDQSYTRTGITLLKDKEIAEMLSLNYQGCASNTEKRICLQSTLQELIEPYRDADITIIVERIRLRSQGFLSESYIKSTGALIATVIDTCYWYGLTVYSVDTRAWKSAIVGTSKPQSNPYGIDPHKYPTIVYLRHKGILPHLVQEYKGKGKKGVIPIKYRSTGATIPCTINDDLADSYCIALYGYLPKTKQKLKEETF